MERRDFMRVLAGGLAPVWAGGWKERESVRTRRGMGTRWVMNYEEPEAHWRVEEALERGFTVWDMVSHCAGGEVERRLGKTLAGRWEQVCCILKTFYRRERNAMPELESSLGRLRTGGVDVWMIHDLRNRYEWEELLRPGSTLEAMDQAKKAGKTRAVGLYAHGPAPLIQQALKDYPFDVLMAPVDTPRLASSFLQDLSPLAALRGIKVMIHTRAASAEKEYDVSNAEFPACGNTSAGRVDCIIHDFEDFPTTQRRLI